MPDNTDPYRAYNFKLIIQGVTEGHFTECTGLTVKVDAIKYREAGNNQVSLPNEGDSRCQAAANLVVELVLDEEPHALAGGPRARRRRLRREKSSRRRNLPHSPPSR